MTLKKDFYKALEDILGPEYVSDDPVITETYALPIRAGMSPETYANLPRFEAITLPKDTQEVQAIVKLCNKHRVQYKASSTGWQYCDPTGPNCIKIDLRRMNHIIEINEKSMYAVVEPYVVGGQLQAECMKRGLNCNLTGAGANCSALPLAAHVNLGHLSQSGSYGERNQLAMEWVTGDGEIVRFGTLGCLDEWFCGDGPGPSLRGIIRGNTVPLGGLGVFTKAAQKLYHWPGPSTFPVVGTSPDYKPAYIPPGFMIRYFSFKTLDEMINAVLKIGEAEIGLELMCFNPAMMASNLGKVNIEEELQIYEKFKKEVIGPGFMIIIASSSRRDFEYRKKVLSRIVEETGGKSLKAVEDPENESGFIWRFIRITASIRETSRIGGFRGGGAVGGTDVFPLMSYFIKAGAPVKEDFIKRGMLFDDGVSPFIQSIEHGHTGHGEILNRISMKYPYPLKVQQEGAERINKIAIDGHFGVPHHVWNDSLHDMYGPPANNYHVWLRKIKKAFDPNEASESSNYISAKE